MNTAVYKQKNRRNRRAAGQRTGLILLAAVIAVVLFCILISPHSTSAGDLDASAEKFYTCYQIQEGDTLWSIAGQFCTEEYPSLQDYIQDVCRINHLSDSDRIYSGRSLCVPYYVRK